MAQFAMGSSRFLSLSSSVDRGLNCSFCSICCKSESLLSAHSIKLNILYTSPSGKYLLRENFGSLQSSVLSYPFILPLLV